MTLLLQPASAFYVNKIVPRLGYPSWRDGGPPPSWRSNHEGPPLSILPSPLSPGPPRRTVQKATQATKILRAQGMQAGAPTPKLQRMDRPPPVASPSTPHQDQRLGQGLSRLLAPLPSHTPGLPPARASAHGCQAPTDQKRRKTNHLHSSRGWSSKIAESSRTQTLLLVEKPLGNRSF